MSNYIEAWSRKFPFKSKMKNSSFLFLGLILSGAFLLTSCRPQDNKPLQESYHIKMGDTSFQIPIDYLVDSRNRIDAEEVEKIEVPPNNRDSRYTPHDYVILMGLIPDVLPLPEARKYNRSPDRTLYTVEFNMSYNPMVSYIGIKNLIRSAAENNTVKLPDFLQLPDGLIKIGYNDKPKGMYEDLYVYIKSKNPIAYIRCARKPEAVNPSCWAYLAYNDSITMNVIFSTENLKWFSEEGGADKILGRVKSWQKVK